MNEKEIATKHLVAGQYFLNVAEELEEKGAKEAESYYCKAIECYTKAAEIEFDNKDLLERIGDLYRKIDNPLRAIELHEKALKIDPTDQKLLRKLAEEYFSATFKVKLSFEKERYYIKSEKLFLKYLRHCPSDADTWISLGFIYHHYLKEYEEAKQCYDKALELQPNNIKAITHVAELQRRLGNYEEAIKLYERRCEITPNDHHPFWSIASVHAEMGDFQKAIDYMKKAIERAPQSSALWEDLEDFYAHIGDYNSAKECRNKAAEIRSKRINQEKSVQGK
jgi:tetratricopeptide (TPR) repeat protein